MPLDREIKITIQAGSGGAESEAWADMVVTMLKGQLVRQAGVHRIVRISPLDPEKRRHTSFARVTVEGQPSSGAQIRSYTLHPYMKAKNLETGVETDKVDAVLSGEIVL